MQDKYFSTRTLNHLVDWLQPLLAETNWFFVALDSTRGDFSKVKSFLSTQLNKTAINHWWQPEGLWLPGNELTKTYVLSQLVVPFSAAYVFLRTIRESTKPRFNKTTDGGAFSKDELRNLGEEIARINAVGYAADGVGLQCLFLDDRFSSLLVPQQ